MSTTESMFHGITDLEEVGVKKAQKLLADGYEILGIYPGSRYVKQDPDDPQSQGHVRRGPRYVMGKRGQIEDGDER